MRTCPIPLTCFILLLCVARIAHPALLAEGEYRTAGKYIGVLPCADCAGTWTEIHLTDPGPDLGQGSGTFVMTERFTGGVHGGAIVTTRGSWSTISWNSPGRNDGIVTLKLVGEGPNGTVAPPRYFRCNHGLSLRLLADADRGIDTIKPVTLRRVIPPPLPIFGPVTEADSKTLLHGQVGDSFEIALPAYTWKMASPASPIVALVVITRSGNGEVFTSYVRLKAVAPGQARLEFQSTQDPAKVVAFSFDIAGAPGNPGPD